MITIKTIGQFRVLDADGKDLTPRGRKSCGLLAILALSPNRRRARRWLQDKLWSDRWHEQGAASLRQCLSEIRRKLGEHKDCIVTDHQTVGLDPTKIEFDLDATLVTSYLPGETSMELLEGIDIRDQEFEDWLREARGQFSESLTQTAATADVSTNSADSLLSPAASRVDLVISQGQPAKGDFEQLMANALLDSAAQSLREMAPIKIVDNRILDPAPGRTILSCGADSLAIHVDTANGTNSSVFRLVLKRSHKMIWSKMFQPDHAHTDAMPPEMYRHINELVSVAIREYVEETDSGDQQSATNLCHQGILHLFRLGLANFLAADTFFERAFELEPKGVYLAWRAYQRTYMLAERKYQCREEVVEEALSFMLRAMEMEPHNSVVAALSAHVYSIVSRSYVAAYELAERSVQINPANPLGWMSLGVAKGHLGKQNDGFEDTLRARALSGSAPYRFQVDALSCIAGVMASRFDEATWIGEAGHALAPGFAPPLRYLSALYLRARQEEKSYSIVEKMQLLEPDFTYEALIDSNYPAAGLRHSELLKYLPIRQI